MYLNTYEKDQLKIYYFFMLVDGEYSTAERGRFDAICEERGVKDEDKREVIGFCEDLAKSSNPTNSVIQEIYILLENNKAIFADNFSWVSGGKGNKISFFWNLMALAHADSECSVSKRHLLKSISDYLKIDDEILADINDTADTILTITKQKEWLKTTNKSYDAVSERFQEMDKEIEYMANNIKILVKEAEIA